MKKNSCIFWPAVLLCVVLLLGFPETIYASSGNNTAKAKKIYTVTFYSNNGKNKIKTVKVTGTETQISAPARKNPGGYTFMGWSEKAKCSKNPKYEPKEKITVKKNMKLYEVLFNKKSEPTVSPALFYKNSKYGKVIFIGDSRTNQMHTVLANAGSANILKNVKFIAQNGTGIKWYRNTAEKLLLQELSLKSSKRTAVIINLGINDLRHESGADISAKAVTNDYIACFNRLAEKLKNKNCDLYYMSLNPVNCKHSVKRRETEIRYFNKMIKSSLPKYKFIDTYSYLVKNGYSTGAPGGKDDGVHFSDKSSRRIYNYCINQICR